MSSVANYDPRVKIFIRQLAYELERVVESVDKTSLLDQCIGTPEIAAYMAATLQEYYVYRPLPAKPDPFDLATEAAATAASLKYGASMAFGRGSAASSLLSQVPVPPLVRKSVALGVLNTVNISGSRSRHSSSSSTSSSRSNNNIGGVDQAPTPIPQFLDEAYVSGVQLLRAIRTLTVDRDGIVRAQAFRALRYLCVSEHLARLMFAIHIDLLCGRTLEKEQKYLWERMQAMKYLRKIVTSYPSTVTRTVCVSLVALAEQPKDDFRRVALDALRELAFTNPAVLASAGGTRVLIDALLDPSLADASGNLTLTLLYLLDQPSTRCYIRDSADLLRLFSVFTDLTAPPSPEREQLRAAAQRALVTMLRSFTGILTLTSNQKALKSLFQMLALPSNVSGAQWAREAVFEILAEILKVVRSSELLEFRKSRLPPEAAAASSAISAPGADSGAGGGARLSAAVGGGGGGLRYSTMGRTAGSRPRNLLHGYMAITLLVLINAGLVEQLAHLAVAEDTDAGATAAAFLVEILRLACGLLPASVCAQLSALPRLMHHATALAAPLAPPPLSSTNPAAVGAMGQVSLALGSAELLQGFPSHFNSGRGGALTAVGAKQVPLEPGLERFAPVGPTVESVVGQLHAAFSARRTHSLRLLNALFTENLRYFSSASTKSAFSSFSSSSRGDDPPGIGGVTVPSLYGSSSSSSSAPFYCAYGINLGCLAQATDTSSDRDKYLPWTARGRPDARNPALLSLRQQLDANVDDATLQSLLKATNILASKDPAVWDFPLALHLLETALTVHAHVVSALKTKFFKRLLSFMRPDKRLFCDLDWNIPHITIVRVAAQVFRVLLSFPEGREYVFFNQLVEQILQHLFAEVSRTPLMPLTSTSSSTAIVSGVGGAGSSGFAGPGTYRGVSLQAPLLTPTSTGSSPHSAGGAGSGGAGNLLSPFARPSHVSAPGTAGSAAGGAGRFGSGGFPGSYMGSGGGDASVLTLTPPSPRVHDRLRAASNAGGGSGMFTLGSTEGPSPPQVPSSSIPFVAPGSAMPGANNAAAFAAFKGLGGGTSGFSGGSAAAAAAKRFRPFSRVYHTQKLAREYVLLISILSSTPTGLSIFDRFNLFETLVPLATDVSKDYLSRSLVAAFDYEGSRKARLLLEAWAVSGSSSLRRAACAQLRTLFRRGVTGFHTWGVDLLLALLHAPDMQVALAALSVLEEACANDEPCVRAVIRRRPSLAVFGSFAYNIHLAMLAHPAGLEMLQQQNWVQSQLHLWREVYNNRFVELLESTLVAALSGTGLSPSASKYTEPSDVNELSSTGGGDAAGASAMSPSAPQNVASSSSSSSSSSTTTTTWTSAKAAALYPSVGAAGLPLPKPTSPPLKVLASKSPTSAYSLYQATSWATSVPAPTDLDDYIATRLQSLPWLVDVVVESASGRAAQLITDTAYITAYGDAGVPLDKPKKSGGLPPSSGPASAGSFIGSTGGVQSGANVATGAGTGAGGKTVAPGGAGGVGGKPAAGQTSTSSSASSPSPSPASVSGFRLGMSMGIGGAQNGDTAWENDVPGAPATYIAATILDVDGNPSPFPVDSTSTLHARLFVGAPPLRLGPAYNTGAGSSSGQGSGGSGGIGGGGSSSSSMGGGGSGGAGGGFGSLPSYYTSGRPTISGASSSAMSQLSTNPLAAVVASAAAQLVPSVFTSFSKYPPADPTAPLPLLVPVEEVERAQRRFFDSLPSCTSVCLPGDRLPCDVSSPTSSSSSSSSGAPGTLPRSGHVGDDRERLRPQDKDHDAGVSAAPGLKPSCHHHDLPASFGVDMSVGTLAAVASAFASPASLVPSMVGPYSSGHTSSSIPSSTSSLSGTSIPLSDAGPVGAGVLGVGSPEPPTGALGSVYGSYGATSSGPAATPKRNQHGSTTNNMMLHSGPNDAAGAKQNPEQLDSHQQQQQHQMDTAELDANTLQMLQGAANLASTLLSYSYHVVVDNVRWNFVIDPAQPLHPNRSPRLLLSSVWFRLPSSVELTPSVCLLPHFLGDVAKTDEGCALLASANVLTDLVATVESETLQPTDKRAALWALGHVGSSVPGFRLLAETSVIQYVSQQALSCPTLSMRGTCFYILGLIAQTHAGRSYLDALGWDCTLDDILVSVAGLVCPRDLSRFLHVPSSPYGASWSMSSENKCGVHIVPRTGEGPGDGAANAATTTTTTTTTTAGVPNNPGAGAAANGLGNSGGSGGLSKASEAEILAEVESSGVVSERACELVLGHISNLCNHVTQRGSLTALRAMKQSQRTLFSSPVCPTCSPHSFGFLVCLCILIAVLCFVLCWLFFARVHCVLTHCVFSLSLSHLCHPRASLYLGSPL